MSQEDPARGPRAKRVLVAALPGLCVMVAGVVASAVLFRMGLGRHGEQALRAAPYVGVPVITWGCYLLIDRVGPVIRRRRP